LRDLQNSDGGWPTFCRGWGRLPFDRSGTDLTAHALRALYAWRELLQDRGRVSAAIRRGLRFLESHQAAGGSWVPLWFGNQDDPREENPVYGTARVLLAYRDLGLLDSPAARRGREWLQRTQNADGGWGSAGRTDPHRDVTSSVEETALAVEALLGASRGPGPSATRQGLDWLVRAVEDGRHKQAAPIGFYFARLWYHERLYPLIFTVSALGQAVRTLLAPTGPDPAHLPT
jgi:squalene-hopene/tetraprenyl-beta-curcumene cyclase